MKIKKDSIYFIALVFCIGLFVLGIKSASAVDLGPILPQCAQTGCCSLCDIINTAMNIGKFVIGIIGSIILVYFIYGGIYMISSGGDSGKVKKGKDIIINSVIGLAIVMFAYVLVFFIVYALVGGQIQGQSPEDWVKGQLKNCPVNPACTAPGTSSSTTAAACTSKADYLCKLNAEATSANGYDCNSSYGTCPSGQTCCTSFGGGF
jgi:hypothetical protein